MGVNDNRGHMGRDDDADGNTERAGVNSWVANSWVVNSWAASSWVVSSWDANSWTVNGSFPAPQPGSLTAA